MMSKCFNLPKVKYPEMKRIDVKMNNNLDPLNLSLIQNCLINKIEGQEQTFQEYYAKKKAKLTLEEEDERIKQRYNLKKHYTKKKAKLAQEEEKEDERIKQRYNIREYRTNKKKEELATSINNTLKDGNTEEEIPIGRNYDFNKNEEEINSYINEPGKILDLVDDISKFRDISQKVLNTYIEGQEHVIKQLSEVMIDHLRNTDNQKENDADRLLLVGSSGTGKTYIATKLCEFYGLPYHIQNMSSITEEGYVGSTLSQPLERLLEKSMESILLGYSPEKRKQIQQDKNYREKLAYESLPIAEYGILFLDEIDKKAKKKENLGKDVSGEGVQNALLKFLDGEKIILNISKDNSRNPHNSFTIPFKTNNLLILMGGAFADFPQKYPAILDKSNISTAPSLSDFEDIDDNKDADNFYENINKNNLVEYGLMRELVNRTDLVILNKLDYNSLYKIFTEKKYDGENTILDYMIDSSYYEGKIHYKLEAIKEVPRIFEMNEEGGRLKPFAKKVRRSIDNYILESNLLKDNKKVIIDKNTLKKAISAYDKNYLVD